MRCYLIFLAFVINSSIAQEWRMSDTTRLLSQLSSSSLPIEKRLNLISQLAEVYVAEQLFESAVIHYEKGFKLAKQHGNKEYMNRFDIFQMGIDPLVKPTDAIYRLKQLEITAKRNGWQLNQAIAQFQSAYLYFNSRNYIPAQIALDRSEVTFKKLNQKAFLVKTETTKALIELDHGHIEKAIRLLKSAAEKARKNKLKVTESKILVNLAECALIAEQPNEAKAYLRKIAKINALSKNSINIAIAYINIAQWELANNHLDSCRYYLNQIHPAIAKAGATDVRQFLYLLLTQHALAQQQPDLAESYLLELYRFAHDQFNPQIHSLYYSTLADIKEQKGEFSASLHARKRFEQVSDSMDQIMKVNNIERYQHEKILGQKLAALKRSDQRYLREKTSKEQTKIIWMSISAAVFLLGLFYALQLLRRYKRYRLKHKIEVKEQVEQERKRISQELHDDIGQLLVSTKYQLKTLANHDSGNILTQLDEQITEIIKKTRELSHDLFNEPKVGIELKKQVESLIKPFESIQDIQIQLHVSNDFIVDPQYGTHILRIIQECLSNTLKHSNTNRIEITILKKLDQLVFLYRDFGKPFEIKSNGIGIKSIQDRIKAIQGVSDLSTEEGFKLKITSNLNSFS